MNTADYKTIREALGLTVQEVATTMGVNIRTAQRWEEKGRPGPPREVEEWITKRWDSVADQISDILEGLENITSDYGFKNFSGVQLSRYENLESARAAGEVELTPRTHAATLAFIKMILQVHGYDAEITWRAKE